MTKKQATGSATVSTGYAFRLASGSIVTYEVLSCDQCGKNMGYIGSPSQTYVRVDHIPHIAVNSGVLMRGPQSLTLCPECAGYLPNQQRFKNLKDYIVESASYLKDMPPMVLADYLEEHGAAAADWIRNHTSGD